nr:DUF3990 domain-containing protein [uncultured Stomatobaculum sp.]
MIVYHGSNQIVEHPDVSYSDRNLDFGRGFYVTTVKKQAEKWARRKAGFSKGSERAILNVYEMKNGQMGLVFKDFGDDLEAWIDFVCSCRDGAQEYCDFDVILGKVANDKVFRVGTCIKAVSGIRRGLCERYVCIRGMIRLLLSRRLL